MFCSRLTLWILQLTLFYLHASEARRLSQIARAPSPAPAQNSGSAKQSLLAFAQGLTNFQEVAKNNNFKGWTASSGDPCSGNIQVERNKSRQCDPENSVYKSADRNPWTGVTCNSQGEVTCICLQDLNLQGPTTALENLKGLSSLSFLDLAQNKISGTFSVSFGHALKQLILLHLEHNSINSSLLQSWGNEYEFPSLEELNLQNNDLTGSLPVAWGNTGRWQNLSILNLFDNHLGGQVPGEYNLENGSFPALQQAILQPGNSFCGTNSEHFPAVSLSQSYISGPVYTNITVFNETCTESGVLTPDYGDYDNLGRAAVAGIIAGEVFFGLLLLLVAGIFHRRYRWRQERSWVLFDWDVVQEPKTTKQFNFGQRFAWMRRSGSSDLGSKRFSLQGSTEIRDAHQNGENGLGSRKFSIPVQAWRDIMFEPHEVRLQQNVDGSLKSLGNGSFGKVYKGVLREHHECAVKVFEGYTGQHERELLLSEIAILRSCKHNNVVQFFGVTLHQNEIWMMMELMQGNLYRHLARGHHCTWYFRGRSIALDIARGMQYLHSKNIIHMDLKSPNILIGDTGIAKLADVGLARVMGSENFVSQVCAGTMHWMAPEVLVHGKCTEKADIFSFGVILWEICTGEAPSRGRMSCVRVPDECPQNVADLIQACMEEEQEKRPSAFEIVERLQAVPISQRPTPNPPWYAR